MTPKCAILNVSYEQPFDFEQVQTRPLRTISRYSDYSRRNKFNQHNTDSKPLIHTLMAHDSPKVSLFQQYKNREMRKKAKLSPQNSNQKHYHSIIVRGSIKHHAKLDHLEQKHLLTPQGISPLHACYKPQTPNIRRRYSYSINSQRVSPSKQNQTQNSKVIGIQGTKTSFLDKYKLKITKEKEDLEEDEKNKKFSRREILCSTKRNRSVQPRLLKTSEFGRKKANKQDQLNFFNFNLHDKIECRPWSPNKDQEFEKL